jgi:hypothetical protein
MESRFNTLAKSLLEKPLSVCSEQELRGFVDQYPYFLPAHLLLLSKLDKESEKYSIQYQKSLLYYHDPLSFENFLSEAEEPLLDDEENKASHAGNNEMATDTDTTNVQVVMVTPPKIPIDISSNTNDLPLAFEPFHTVDYFASQGIKPATEDVPKDKLGKQLKSFTEWLKTMKRIPPTEIPVNEPLVERQVESMAAHSVQDADIVTESMAEVWLKQGNKEKAKATYQKLSLLDPSKSAYFAAKIQNLNEQKTI